MSAECWAMVGSEVQRSLEWRLNAEKEASASARPPSQLPFRPPHRQLDRVPPRGIHTSQHQTFSDQGPSDIVRHIAAQN